MQFTIPATATVVVRKVAREVTGIDSWPLVSIEKVFAYGLQQLANDAAAPAKTEAEVESFVTKRLANLAAGIMRASAIRASDPVSKEAAKIARAKVLAALKKAGKTEKDDDVDMGALVKATLAKYPDIRAQAEINVAAEADLEIEIDLD